MDILNIDLLLNIILPSLIGGTLWSALIAVVVGTVVGFIVGAIRGRIARTILPAIGDCFFGTLLIGILPIVATPGIIGGGAYGGLAIIAIAAFTLPIGAIGGAIVGSVANFSLLQRSRRRWALIVLAATYGFMALVIGVSATVTCTQSNTLPDYCSQAGFPS